VRQRWSGKVAYMGEITAYRNLLEKSKGRDELGDVITRTGDMPTINPTSVLYIFFFRFHGVELYVQNVLA